MTSYVIDTGLAQAGESAAFFADKLRFHTDAADVAHDLREGDERIVVIDTRNPQAYAAAHIPGAISFPHWQMNAESTEQLDRSKVYVCYCVGIGCNGSTWGAYRLASLGFTVKEMLGGISAWKEEGYPVVAGEAPGRYDDSAIRCAC